MKKFVKTIKTLKKLCLKNNLKNFKKPYKNKGFFFCKNIKKVLKLKAFCSIIIMFDNYALKNRSEKLKNGQIYTCFYWIFYTF